MLRQREKEKKGRKIDGLRGFSGVYSYWREGGTTVLSPALPVPQHTFHPWFLAVPFWLKTNVISFPCAFHFLMLLFLRAYFAVLCLMTKKPGQWVSQGYVMRFSKKVSIKIYYHWSMHTHTHESAHTCPSAPRRPEASDSSGADDTGGCELPKTWMLGIKLGFSVKNSNLF